MPSGNIGGTFKKTIFVALSITEPGMQIFS